MLEYAIVHEVGHLLDFANHLNAEGPTVDCNFDEIKTNEDYFEKCKPMFQENTWGRIDWINSMQIQPAKDYNLRSRLCFYNCQTLLNPEQDTVPLYSGFAKSSFASTYGSSNVMDDFAEAWAARWLLQTKKSDIIVSGSANLSIRSSEIYNSERFKVKREFIEKFVNGPIAYP